MAREPLAVWLGGVHVATLQTRRGGLRLEYTDDARGMWPLGTPVVSVAMPLSARPHGSRQALPFFEGLLPEGDVRRMTAYDVAVDEADTFGLLTALGRDCAGALVLLPVSEEPPHPPGSGAEPIDDAEVARRVDDLRLAPLGVDGRVRVSLPGMQRKLLLARLADGSWALPVGGAPSTHILKPPISLLEHSVENEAICMRVARRVGLDAAALDVGHIGGRPVLVVERFDREIVGGAVRRIHQEDTCQALSIPTANKYEERGGPSLRQVATLLRSWQAPTDDVLALLRATTFAVAIGDADRHGKNVSIVHSRDGRVRLAPLYDVMCTRFYPNVSTTLGMFVHDTRDIDGVGVDDLVEEGVAWGLSRRVARAAVTRLVDDLPDAIEIEVQQSPWVPPALGDFLVERATRLRARSRTTARTPASHAGPPSPGERVWVQPYRRTDGTPVRGHWRALGADDVTAVPDGSPPRVRGGADGGRPAR